MIWRGVVVAVAALWSTGCAPTAPELMENNSTATIASSSLSDDDYVAFRDTHEHSPKIPKMIVSLIKSHFNKGEFLLAQFYCDEYHRDFPSGKERDEVDYLHLKILFYRYDREHDDRIADQARVEAKRYLADHGIISSYRSRVAALLERLQQRENTRNEELAEYYKGKGKPKAEEFYREKVKN